MAARHDGYTVHCLYASQYQLLGITSRVSGVILRCDLQASHRHLVSH